LAHDVPVGAGATLVLHGVNEAGLEAAALDVEVPQQLALGAQQVARGNREGEEGIGSSISAQGSGSGPGALPGG
jgi:hypothetical protein